ncbi:MAG: hypothetical protein HYZ53_30980 [Planctomycetes bacterium]|nr:hypothetical protein [Planctomycetota bacterium]
MMTPGLRCLLLDPETGWRMVGAGMEGLEALPDGLRLASRSLPLPADGTLPPATPGSGQGFLAEGRVVLGPLDGGEAGCTWHRVELEADIPTGTALVVQTLTSEQSADPAPARPGTGTAAGDGWSSPQVNPTEFLVQSRAGRYLWIRVSFRGGTRATPRLASLSVRFPRVTSARFLPAVYRESSKGDGFLERFVSVFDRALEPIRSGATEFQARLDPLSAPADFLPWLAGILGVANDPAWPTEARRRFLARAGRLFRTRGTPAGIADALEAFLGRRPSLEEHFRRRPEPTEAEPRAGIELPFRVGVDPDREAWYAHAHRFTVVLRPGECADDAARRALARVVEAEKPAHTLFDFRVGEEGPGPALVPEGPAAPRIGVDAVLGEEGMRL